MKTHDEHGCSLLSLRHVKLWFSSNLTIKMCWIDVRNVHRVFDCEISAKRRLGLVDITTRLRNVHINLVASSSIVAVPWNHGRLVGHLDSMTNLSKGIFGSSVVMSRSRLLLF